jgi:hypothetical protein
MRLRSITSEEVARFHEEGWAFLPGLVDPPTAAHLYERGQAALRGRGMSQEFDEVVGGIVSRCFRVFEGEDRQSSFAREILLSPIMGDNLVRLLKVSRARVWADTYLVKLPEKGGRHAATVYHQDFPGNPIDRSNFLAVWVALHDMPAAAGTLRFYKRSHTRGVFGQVFVDGLDVRSRYDLHEEDLSPPLDMRAGDATIHHCLVAHGAPPNRTNQSRWAYQMTYMDADSRYTRSPGPLPEGIAIEPYGLFDDPIFPVVPTL